MDLSIWDSILTFWNAFCFYLRKKIRFSRKGYSEKTAIAPKFSPEAFRINEKFNFTEVGQKLSPQNWHRNLATLWYLEQMFKDIKWTSEIFVIEPGCQNFSRLPSLRSFFDLQSSAVKIIGIELDAFVPLKGFHSLWDHAQYYISLKNDGAQYLDCDFFKYQNPADVIVCFYPFVSSAPALAWGLPASVAGADKWIKAFENNLKPNGYVFVVHQGDWEEADFDSARESSSLKLIRRQELVCPFFSTKHPARGSLYQKSMESR